MQFELLGNFVEFGGIFLEMLDADIGRYDGFPVVADETLPVDRVLAKHGCFFQNMRHHRLAFFESCPARCDLVISLFLGNDFVIHEALGIQRAGGWQAADYFIHQRLGDGRFVCFVVSLAAIAEQVNDDILMKPLAKIQRHLCREYDCFGIIAVNMENRRVHHLGDIAAIIG